MEHVQPVCISARFGRASFGVLGLGATARWETIKVRGGSGQEFFRGGAEAQVEVKVVDWERGR